MRRQLGQDAVPDRVCKYVARLRALVAEDAVVEQDDGSPVRDTEQGRLETVAGMRRTSFQKP